jgi:hypothetical protein
MEFKSVGMIIPFPTEWKNNRHVPNHQPVSGFEETLQLVFGGRKQVVLGKPNGRGQT